MQRKTKKNTWKKIKRLLNKQTQMNKIEKKYLFLKSANVNATIIGSLRNSSEQNANAAEARFHFYFTFSPEWLRTLKCSFHDLG